MCMIEPQNYMMSFLKSIMINTINFETLQKESWMINMILKNYFLKNMIIVCGQKIKKNN